MPAVSHYDEKAFAKWLTRAELRRFSAVHDFSSAEPKALGCVTIIFTRNLPNTDYVTSQFSQHIK